MKIILKKHSKAEEKVLNAVENKPLNLLKIVSKSCSSATKMRLKIQAIFYINKANFQEIF